MPEPEDGRTAEARARAEQALAWLLAGLEGAEIEMIVLGGLVPQILTQGREVEVPAHLGTTDVDILLVTHVDQDDDLGAVERSLRSLEFEPEPDGWRWLGRVEGRKVKIEFLCDLESYAEEEVISPVGCEKLTALNLRGTRFVAEDWTWEEIKTNSREGTPLIVRARFAGLQGYLLSKCYAVRHRGAEKDYYDLVYVLLHNREGGPLQAAQLLLGGKLSHALPGMVGVFREIDARFDNPNDFAARCYASQMALVEPELDQTILRGDAVAAVAEFFQALRYKGP